MKKISLLFAMLAMVVSGAWADGITAGTRWYIRPYSAKTQYLTAAYDYASQGENKVVYSTEKKDSWAIITGGVSGTFDLYPNGRSGYYLNPWNVGSQTTGTIGAYVTVGDDDDWKIAAVDGKEGVYTIESYTKSGCYMTYDSSDLNLKYSFPETVGEAQYFYFDEAKSSSIDTSKEYYIVEKSTGRYVASGLSEAAGVFGLNPEGTTTGDKFVLTSTGSSTYTVATTDGKNFGTNGEWNTADAATEWTLMGTDTEDEYTFSCSTGYLKYQTSYPASLFTDGVASTTNVFQLVEVTYDVTLDETDETDEYPWDYYKTYDITLNRTMKAGRWNTLMIPFDMTNDQVKAAFGETAKVMKMTSIKNNVVNFTTEETPTIAGGEAYIVEPAADVTKIEFKGVSAPGVSIINSWMDSYCVKGCTYQSTLDESDYKNKPIYVLSNNKFYQVDSEETVKGFRWVIYDYSSFEAKQGLSLSLDGEIVGDVATAISSVNSEQLTVNNGKYLQNGKLVIKKDGKQFNAAGAQIK